MCRKKRRGRGVNAAIPNSRHSREKGRGVSANDHLVLTRSLPRRAAPQVPTVTFSLAANQASAAAVLRIGTVLSFKGDILQAESTTGRAV